MKYRICLRHLILDEQIHLIDANGGDTCRSGLKIISFVILTYNYSDDESENQRLDNLGSQHTSVIEDGHESSIVEFEAGKYGPYFYITAFTMKVVTQFY